MRDEDKDVENKMNFFCLEAGVGKRLYVNSQKKDVVFADELRHIIINYITLRYTIDIFGTILNRCLAL